MTSAFEPFKSGVRLLDEEIDEEEDV